MAKSKKKSDIMYAGHTMEEVMAIEALHYYIQIGHEMLESETGKLSFTKDRADELFDRVFESLKHMKKFGTPEEKADAQECLLNFRIWPLRIH
jgi:hypothetical protein